MCLKDRFCEVLEKISQTLNKKDMRLEVLMGVGKTMSPQIPGNHYL